MKYALPLLLAAALAAATPAMADHDRDRGGGWHGGNGGGGWRGGDRGGEARGGGDGRGGRWGGPGGQGGQGGGPAGPPAEGRWRGGYPGAEGGGLYAGPQGRRGDYREEQGEARQGVRSGQIKSMGEIVGRLQSRGGRMLDAHFGQGPNGEPVYRVVWASPGGRRTDFIIDARTGAILQGY